VVVNGNAKNVTREVIRSLDDILRGTDLFVSRSMDEACSIAETLVERGYGTVLTGGGDGTFTVMVTLVVRAAQRLGQPLPRFGFLSLGTGNALAHVVGASGQRTLAADIQRLRNEAGSRKIGLVESEGLLAPFCGLGADARVLLDYDEVKTKLGKGPLRSLATGALGYAISSLTRTLPSELFGSVPECRIVNRGAPASRVGEQGRLTGELIETGQLIYEGPARIIGLSTIPYYGFGLRMFPYVDDHRDRMALRVATLTAPEFVGNARAIWKGEYANPNSIKDFLVQDVEIEMNTPTPFQIGGDVKGERVKVRVNLFAKPIRLVDFYAPPSGARS
jgi:diacylglycerol kinase family enzyme